MNVAASISAGSIDCGTVRGPPRVSVFDLNMYVYFCTGIGCGVESMSFNAMGKDVPDLSWDLVRPFCSLV